jgi:2,4'-dihydroxyacetophenone dioxygenase
VDNGSNPIFFRSATSGFPTAIPSRRIPPELIVPNAIPTDERIWVPVEENVWFRPLCLSASRGYWMNLLRVRKSGVLSRHRHPQPVHGFVLKGEWRYLEHDWVATEGGYVYEAPGETHTLVVDEHVEEMITLFQVNGAMIYVDPDGRHVGASLGRVAVGTVLAIVLAVPLGIAMGVSRGVSVFLTPPLRFFSVLAGIAWIPIATCGSATASARSPSSSSTPSSSS